MAITNQQRPFATGAGAATPRPAVMPPTSGRAGRGVLAGPHFDAPKGWDPSAPNPYDSVPTHERPGYTPAGRPPLLSDDPNYINNLRKQVQTSQSAKAHKPFADGRVIDLSNDSLAWDPSTNTYKPSWQVYKPSGQVIDLSNDVVGWDQRRSSAKPSGQVIDLSNDVYVPRPELGQQPETKVSPGVRPAPMPTPPMNGGSSQRLPPATAGRQIPALSPLPDFTRQDPMWREWNPADQSTSRQQPAFRQQGRGPIMDPTIRPYQDLMWREWNPADQSISRQQPAFRQQGRGPIMDPTIRPYQNFSQPIGQDGMTPVGAPVPLPDSNMGNMANSPFAQRPQPFQAQYGNFMGGYGSQPVTAQRDALIGLINDATRSQQMNAIYNPQAAGPMAFDFPAMLSQSQQMADAGFTNPLLGLLYSGRGVQ